MKSILFGVGTMGLAVTVKYTNWYTNIKKIHARCLTDDSIAPCHWNYNWDRRHHAAASGESAQQDGGDGDDKPRPVNRHIILIRHGQYNMEGASDKERALTELGQHQAELTGERLRNDFGFRNIKRMICSTMTRAIETGQIISKYLPGVPVEYCPLIEEGAPIRPIPPTTIIRPDYEFYVDGARIEAAFRRYIYRAPPTQERSSYDIIVCHSNVIRYFVCRALQLPPEAWSRFGLTNGSITWLIVRPDGTVNLVALSECGHMSLNEQSSS